MTDSRATAPQAVMNAYRKLEEQASRMASLAGEQRWEALIGEEEEYVMAVAALADLEQGVELTDGQNRLKREILQRILTHDQATRHSLVARRDELAQLMAVSRRERDLGRAYGAVAGTLATVGPRSEKGRS